jgi:phenylpyruvate tautomerase PptA (4-oxalocrotonate tautomerase family)
MDQHDETRRDSELPVIAQDVKRRTMLRTAGIAAGAALLSPGTTAPAAAAPLDSFGAPLAEIHVPASVLTLEQKSAMIKGVSEVLIKAMKLPPERFAYLWVQVIETSAGGWGVGGQVFVPRTPAPAQNAPKE